MNSDTSSTSTARNDLRLKPGIIIVILQWTIRFGLPLIAFELTPPATFAGLIGWVAVAVWWGFFSRASRFDRLLGVVLMLLAITATPLILHDSISKAFNGVIFVFYFTPILSLTFVAWATLTRQLADKDRRVALVVTILLTSGAWALLRFDGMAYTGGAEFAWRWTETSEERFLSAGTPTPDGRAVVTSTEPAWPGFRGPERNSQVRGVRPIADWTSHPPVEIWRRPVGPGWSSFAVSGSLIYTQEQHGEEEIVSCYELETGLPVWHHRDPTRFWEAIGGPGPRATPTLHDGRVYAFGATGILNVLDAEDGSVQWSARVSDGVNVGIPTWGFASSPLIVDDLVIVAAAATPAAYDLATGKLRWSGTEQGGGYSSPHLWKQEDRSQVLLLTSGGLNSYAPSDGSVLWQHEWSGDGIVQPAEIEGGDILLGTGSQSSRIDVSRTGGWEVREVWSANGLKPYFNDVVIHKGYVYGLDGRHLACIDLKTGERQWKGGRFGGGQLLLLNDADLLLVLSEHGEVALVAAQPDGFTERARFQAIEGKTWNHPVLVDDILLVRNGQEMAAFRLELERS